jgi:hypothetical protein
VEGPGSNRIARPVSAICGLVLAVGAVPLAFLIAVIAGGGHGSPFGNSPAEAVFGGALLGVPALLFLLGLALIRGGLTERWGIAIFITILIPLDAAVAATALWRANRPPPPIYVPPDPKAVIPGQPVMAVPTCTPEGVCTTPPPRAMSRSEPVGSEGR